MRGWQQAIGAVVGLEWLYRLWQQPKRFPRIFRATILFPIRLLFARM
jgi:UDP-N-acetyl-D-mannosaminuronic acid transferase (WecB/TagA/CpsF family)